jgi:MFS family permease
LSINPIAVKISVHYFLTSCAYFGLMSSLVVILQAGASAASVGAFVGLFLFASKIAKIPLAPLLDRFPPGVTAACGCMLASVAFLLLARAQSGMAIMATLFIAATGISINALSAKQLAAAAADQIGNRGKLFSLVNVVVNCSSALAAPVALFFVGQHQHQGVLNGVALVYLLAASLAYVNFNAPAPSRVEQHGSPLGRYLEIFLLTGMPGFLLMNLFGWFLYGQLFNAFALYVSSALNIPVSLGALYSLNAVLVIVLQLPVTHWVQKAFKGTRYVHAAAYLIFAVAFCIPPGMPGLAGAILFIVLFTAAEMLFMPNVDVRMLELVGDRSRAIAYGLLSLSSAAGEALGSASGISMYQLFAQGGYRHGYWIAMTVLAFVFTAVTLAFSRRPSQPLAETA